MKKKINVSFTPTFFFLGSIPSLLVTYVMLITRNICFRDQLKRRYNLGEYWLSVELEDLSGFDEMLGDKLSKTPSEILPLVSELFICLAIINMGKFQLSFDSLQSSDIFMVLATCVSKMITILATLLLLTT